MKVWTTGRTCFPVLVKTQSHSGLHSVILIYLRGVGKTGRCDPGVHYSPHPSYSVRTGTSRTSVAVLPPDSRGHRSNRRCVRGVTGIWWFPTHRGPKVGGPTRGGVDILPLSWWTERNRSQDYLLSVLSRDLWGGPTICGSGRTKMSTLGLTKRRKGPRLNSSTPQTEPRLCDFLEVRVDDTGHCQVSSLRVLSHRSRTELTTRQQVSRTNETGEP